MGECSISTQRKWKPNVAAWAAASTEGVVTVTPNTGCAASRRARTGLHHANGSFIESPVLFVCGAGIPNRSFDRTFPGGLRGPVIDRNEFAISSLHGSCVTDVPGAG